MHDIVDVTWGRNLRNYGSPHHTWTPGTMAFSPNIKGLRAIILSTLEVQAVPFWACCVFLLGDLGVHGT